MEDTLKVFVMKGGIVWAAFAIAFVMVTESGKQTELELMGGLALATEAPPESLFDVGPGVIVKDLSRPHFRLQNVFTCNVPCSIMLWRRKLQLQLGYRCPPTIRKHVVDGKERVGGGVRHGGHRYTVVQSLSHSLFCRFG